MRQAIFEFILKHILKLFSAAIMGIGYLAWSFVQMPYKAAADISTLQYETKQIHKELQELQISNGTNNLLLQRMDGKMDKLQETVIKLSSQPRYEGHRQE